MSTPQPYPWQTDKNEGDSLEDRLTQYEDAKKRTRRAGKAGQLMVQQSWQNVADETAHLLVAMLLSEIKSLQEQLQNATQL
jgi:hypothetical protein